MTRRLLVAFIATLTAGLTAWASPQGDDYVRLARLSYIEGHVSFQHTSDVDWSAASVNLPLEPGDRIYTGREGRAEIEFDDGSVCRLAENTDLEILSLKEELIQLRILVGLSTLTVSSNLDFEINTPAAAFNTLRQGVYRFDVVENGDSDAIVRKGELEAANNDFSRRIQSGELLHVSRAASQNPVLSRYDGRDEWDEWNDRRDADMNAYASRKYLPDTVYMGSAELDRYGRWVDVDSYGMAWVPFGMDAYWSPYSVGRWCYRPFFGWTWVSYEPWGWLPYHYGRWYHSVGFGWCWLPGPAFAFNFWSPGLVTFYSGPGWISWCPLGPGDYYDVRNYHFNKGIYSYQLSRLRALQTRPAGDLFNRNVRGAFRTTQIERFRNGSFRDRGPGAGWGNIDQPWRNGSLVRDRLGIQPTARSFSAAPDRTAVRPSATNRFPAVVRTNPGIDAGNRERFTRITNPNIPSFPSRSLRNNGEAGNTTGARNGSTPNVRVIQTPQERSPNQGVRIFSGNRQENQQGRTPTTPRGFGSSGNNGENPVNRGRTAPAIRPENKAPSNQQNSPKLRNERTAPSQKPSSEGRQKSSNSILRSSADAGWGNSGSAFSRTPEAGSPAIYTVPGQTNPSRSNERSVQSRSWSTPSAIVPGQTNPSWSSQRSTQSRSLNMPSTIAPRQASPSWSSQRSTQSRSFSAPSAGRSAAGSAGSFSTRRSGGGVSSGRPAGGGNRGGRNRR